MGFYYVSIFSIFLLGIVYGVLLLIFWGIARVTRGLPGRKALLGIVAAAFLVLPVGEELWIAWNFGQACKEAGTFVYKKVEVEGFYDETRPGRPGPLTEQAKKSMDQSGYRFHERPFRAPEGGPSKVVRFEKIDGEWTSRVLDRPTARYHYTTPRVHIAIGHKMTVIEKIVTDSQSSELIARQVIYARKAPWYFVSLDAPVKLCGDDLKGLLYEEVLKPQSPSTIGSLP